MKTIIWWGPKRDIELFIKPMYGFFKKNGLKIILLTHDLFHRNIWEDSKRNNAYCEVVDISKLSLKQIVKTISNISPVSIVLTYYQSLMHYNIIKIANLLSIQTIFVQHGIFNSKIEKLSSPNIFNGIHRYIKYSLLYYQFIFYNENIFKLTKVLYDIVVRRKIKQYYSFNKAVVYSIADRNFIEKNVGINYKDIYLSGYSMFESIEENIVYSANKVEKDNTIVYLHQPSEDFIPNFDYKNEIEYFSRIDKICTKNGYKLIIKLHPRSNLDCYSEIDGFNKINMIQNVDLLKLIKKSNVVIGMFSTAFYYAIINKIPIIQLFYPNNNYQLKPFDEISLRAHNFDELDEILSDKKILNSNIELYKNFIDLHMGKNNSFEHLANTIVDIANK